MQQKTLAEFIEVLHRKDSNLNVNTIFIKIMKGGLEFGGYKVHFDRGCIKE